MTSACLERDDSKKVITRTARRERLGRGIGCGKRVEYKREHGGGDGGGGERGGVEREKVECGRGWRS